MLMEQILEYTLLYDFYGELLTEHQQQVFQAMAFDDLTCSEVAREQGISRQGVHDMFRRVIGILEGYEQKLHLVEQFVKTREKVEEINRLAQKFFEDGDAESIRRIQRISKEIVEL